MATLNTSKSTVSLVSKSLGYKHSRYPSIPFSTKVADISELTTHFRDMSLISLDNTLQTITEDFHTSTPTKRLIKQQTHEGKWYRYTEWQRRITQIFSSRSLPNAVMFLGCLGYFCSRFSPLSWEHHANMPHWHKWQHQIRIATTQVGWSVIAMTSCQADIAMTTYYQTNRLRFMQRSSWQHGKLTLPPWHKSRVLQHSGGGLVAHSTTSWDRHYSPGQEQTFVYT